MNNLSILRMAMQTVFDRWCDGPAWSANRTVRYIREHFICMVVNWSWTKNGRLLVYWGTNFCISTVTIWSMASGEQSARASRKSDRQICFNSQIIGKTPFPHISTCRLAFPLWNSVRFRVSRLCSSNKHQGFGDEEAQPKQISCGIAERFPIWIWSWYTQGDPKYAMCAYFLVSFTFLSVPAMMLTESWLLTEINGRYFQKMRGISG